MQISWNSPHGRGCAKGDNGVPVLLQGTPHGYHEDCSCYPCRAGRTVCDNVSAKLVQTCSDDCIVEVSCKACDPPMEHHLYDVETLADVEDCNRPDERHKLYVDALRAVFARSAPCILMRPSIWSRRAAVLGRDGDTMNVRFYFVYHMQIRILKSGKLHLTDFQEVAVQPRTSHSGPWETEVYGTEDEIADFVNAFYTMPEVTLPTETRIRVKTHAQGELTLLPMASYTNGNALWTISSAEGCIDLHVRVRIEREAPSVWDDRHLQLWTEFLRQRQRFDPPLRCHLLELNTGVVQQFVGQHARHFGHHALQPPAEHGDPQDRPIDRHQQLHGLQTDRTDAADRHHPRRHPL